MGAKAKQIKARRTEGQRGREGARERELFDGAAGAERVAQLREVDGAQVRGRGEVLAQVACGRASTERGSRWGLTGNPQVKSRRAGTGERRAGAERGGLGSRGVPEPFMRQKRCMQWPTPSMWMISCAAVCHGGGEVM